jgi:hypothetical protein
MFIRSIKKKNKKYYYIAKTIRNGKKITQKSILYIGTADKLYNILVNIRKN